MKTFFWPVRVYYEDTDSGGVVYYANYLKFMERARTEWLRSLGVEQDVLTRERGIMFVVRAARLDYYRPARFNDLLQVSTRIAEARGASLVVEQSIANTMEPDKPLCHGWIKVACVDSNSFKPKKLPHMILTEIVGER